MTAASSTHKPTLHLDGHGDLPFALQFGQAAKQGGTVPFLIVWSGGPGDISLYGLYVPVETIVSSPALNPRDREFVAWLEALRDSTLIAGVRHPAGVRIMAINIPPALERVSPAAVVASARAALAELIQASGAVALTVELFQVEQRNPLRLSIMDRQLAETWGANYQAAGLELLADRRPIHGTRYTAPAVYGQLLRG